ncbi:DUF4249 domain-containing protein [Pedobacter sp. SYSU D00535]|uniref:DUF4249 domain-containing protein n=1 Tax=Pedobacter sp. SYSU D00535 TaxID=2810308 RepID=UPI001A9590EA|nr:DUF4249 domain-containing protein [Pedobacter sp. SYSU D00535]
MRKKLGFLALFLSTVFQYACEKVIDVDLNSAGYQYVVEGTVVNQADSQVVKISRSVAVSDASVFPAVSGATVTVTDDQGGQFAFRERRPGVYSSRRLRGTPGRTYTLNVQVEGNVFTASSRMPAQVAIDSIGVSMTSFFDEEQKTVQLLFSDPPNRANYYRYVLGVNGKKSRNIFAYNDEFTDGRKVNRELFDFDLNLKTGDIAHVEMHCIDAVLYRYWQGLDQNENRGGASTTPANPVTNIKGGALGYFSAHTVQRESVVIP